MIEFACAHCGNRFQIENEHAGKQAQCNKCKKPVTIPSPTDPTGRQLSTTRDEMEAREVQKQYEPLKDAHFWCTMLSRLFFGLGGLVTVIAFISLFFSHEDGAMSFIGIASGISMLVSASVLLAVGAICRAMHGMALNLEVMSDLQIAKYKRE